MKVQLQSAATGFHFDLEEEQGRGFAEEIAEATAVEPAIGVLPRLAPDCTIRVSEGGGADRVYELYARGAVLHEKATNQTWQFPVGSRMLERLKARERGGAPSAPPVRPQPPR